MTAIVKRRGYKQEFDERKLYASVYAACLSSHVKHEEAESIANLVCREIKKWLTNLPAGRQGKAEVLSDEIFKQAGEELKHLNKEASFMYLTHRDVS